MLNNEINTCIEVQQILCRIRSREKPEIRVPHILLRRNNGLCSFFILHELVHKEIEEYKQSFMCKLQFRMFRYLWSTCYLCATFAC